MPRRDETTFSGPGKITHQCHYHGHIQVNAKTNENAASVLLLQAQFEVTELAEVV